MYVCIYVGMVLGIVMYLNKRTIREKQNNYLQRSTKSINSIDE